MTDTGDNRYLLKFVVVSAISFFVGSVHGVLQVIPPIRAWLDSIGSPYGGPGHMIDPLAHAHINLIGGVTILSMATAYYLTTRIVGKRLYSAKLASASFWLATLGIYSFYSVLMIFGTVEGFMLLEGADNLDEFHRHFAGPAIAVSASVMGVGLWLFLFNILRTALGK